MEDFKIVDNNQIFFVLLFIIAVSIAGGFFDNNISMLLLPLIFTLFGIVVTYILNLEGNIKNSIYIFLLFFGIYLFYNLVVSFGLIHIYGVENIKSDEEWFFEASNDIYSKIKNGYNFLEVAGVQEYKDTSGAVYLYGFISYLAKIYGNNSFLIQKVGTSFIASLIPMVMYGISRLYFSEKISIKVAIIYGLLSFILFFSSTLLRDTHIALMFILTMYIILQRLSFINFLILLFVSFYSYYLREQTGIFMIGFTLIYLFVFIHNSIQNIYIEAFIYLSILSIVIILILYSDKLIYMFEQISSASSQRSLAQASSSSIGAKIAKLPFGLNILTLFGFGQIQPFPPSLIFTKNHKGIFELPYLIAGISWFIGWGFLLYGIFKDNILKQLDSKLFFMFLFSILYITLISIIEFSQRRQMAVYPILFLVMVLSYKKMSVTARTKIWVGMIFSYLIMVLVFYFMKL
jgi:hypothetical protein